jgi:SAM-dependent methyltransferase
VNDETPADLQRIYARRFQQSQRYRRGVWRVLIDDFFQRYVRLTDTVLDLGAGYGEFIAQVACSKRFAMDLNPDVPERVGPGVTCLVQDCSRRWPLAAEELDVVFASNFFEHLPDKTALGHTLDEARRCLKPAGRLIALGPNSRYLPGAYWDFWDHFLPLTERSLSEALENREFAIERCLAKFLPYTMFRKREYPLLFVRLYLKLPLAWPLFGKQFLLIARKL